jgi:AcrB/AcrD/AcrF family protein
MIHRIIDFSVRNTFLVLLLVAAGALAGVHALRNVPLDAIPDLGETQVIVYSRWDRSPDVVEAQVTYPIVTAMLGAPNVRAVRGFAKPALQRVGPVHGVRLQLLGWQSEPGRPAGGWQDALPADITHPSLRQRGQGVEINHATHHSVPIQPADSKRSEPVRPQGRTGGHPGSDDHFPDSE